MTTTPTNPAKDQAMEREALIEELEGAILSRVMGNSGLDRIIVAKSAIRAALASPAAVPEPAAWQFRCYSNDPDNAGWCGWEQATESGLEYFKGKAATKPHMYEIRPVYAGPQPAASEPTRQAEFEVWQGDELCAGTSGKRDTALVEAMRYAHQYSQDGAVRVVEVKKTDIAALNQAPAKETL